MLEEKLIRKNKLKQTRNFEENKDFVKRCPLLSLNCFVVFFRSHLFIEFDGARAGEWSTHFKKLIYCKNLSSCLSISYPFLL